MKFFILLVIFFLFLISSKGQTFPTYFAKISRTSGSFQNPFGNNTAFGFKVTSIGDLDDDGINDIASGAFLNRDGTTNGGVYIMYMNRDGTVKSNVDIKPIEVGESDAWGAGTVCGLGDLNGDGIEDIGVGAGYDQDGGAQHGAFWILFLNKNGTIKAYQKISNLHGGFTGHLDDFAVFGRGAVNLGDLDQDGVIDIAVSADRNNGYGSVFILFMKPDGTVKNHKEITNGTGGLNLSPDGYFGYGIDKIGDLDKDGVIDLVVGAHNSDFGGTDLGALWIIYLTSTGNVKAFKRHSPGSRNFTEPSYSKLGISVASIGDYNGDGNPDVVVGGYTGSGVNGAIWYIMMNQDGTIQSFHKISANSGSTNLVLNSGDLFGGSMCNIGDLNQDGIVDIAVGAYFDNDGGPSSGAIWISSTCPTLSADAGADMNICSAQPLSLSALSPSSGIGQWSLIQGAGQIVNPLSPTSQISHPSIGINKFKWTVNTNCNTASDIVTVTVDPIVKPSAGPDQVICPESISPIILTALPATYGTGRWYILKGGGTLTSNTSTTTVSNPSVGLNLFVWEVSLPAYCPNQRDTVAVQLIDAFNASVPQDSIFACTNPVDIEADKPTLGTGLWTITGGDALIQKSTDFKTQITLNQGTAIVNLTWAVGIPGCQYKSTALTIKYITLNEDDLPNVITPNGDGKNDVWLIPKLKYMTTNTLKIYNRWGGQVFSAENYKNNWGDPILSPGIYYYSLDISGCKQFYKGSIQIIH